MRKGWVTGWVKPLFRHVKAYSPETDEHKPLGERLREHLVDLAHKILKNRPRQENEVKGRRVAASTKPARP